MQGKPPFCKEFAVPPRVHIPTDLIRGDGASGYVLILCSAFDFIVWSGSTRGFGFTRGWAGLFLSLTADRDDPFRSVGSITSSMKSSFQVMKAMFSTTLADSKLAAKASLRRCKSLSVVSRRRENWRRDCMRYGLFLSVFVTVHSQGFPFRYCIPMDNDRPSLDLKYFDDICPDKNGTSEHNLMNRRSK
jgi:hypothetical protein